MKRYYFDIREGDQLIPDEEGIELPSPQAAQEEAVRSLGDLARDAPGTDRDGAPRRLAIEVRDESGPMMQLKFSFELRGNIH
jgi:hypothetical protein